MSSFSKRRSWGPPINYPLVESYTPTKEKFIVIAGPCSVENSEMIHDLALKVRVSGATHLRGGIFRAGTYPSKNFGLVSESLLNSFQVAAKLNNLENIIEVLDYSENVLNLVAKYCSAFQVGARQTQNYKLLRMLGQFEKPVFLKRNTGCTVDEWLGAAEHLLVGGVKEIYLIERGSSTFHNDVRWTPCLHVIPSVKALSKIPVIVDAAHGTGRRDLVESMTLAGVAAGAGGFLCEVHEDPEHSLSDPDQAITPKEFETICSRVKLIRGALY